MKTQASDVHMLGDNRFPFMFAEMTGKNGDKHTMYSVVNEMSGDRMTAIDNDPPFVNMSIQDTEKMLERVGKDMSIDCVITNSSRFRNFNPVMAPRPKKQHNQ